MEFSKIRQRPFSKNKVLFLVTSTVFLVIIFSSTLLSWESASLNPITNYHNWKSGSSSVKNPSSYVPPTINWENYMDQLDPIDFGNSTMIFNTIYAALKQGPSDIHPLGLTYFPAMIPKGTLLYHATSHNSIPESFEWLALDHEFSYSFGVKFPRYGRNSSKNIFGGRPHRGSDGPERGNDTNTPHPPSGNGNDKHYFLTFEATRDLNKLIYLDGASAAKSETGEMDTQKLLNDVIESRMSNDPDKDEGSDHDGKNKHVMEERLYAERICQWGKPLGLDGYVRVEVGFEVVLCDFFNGSVDLISNITIPSPADTLGLPPPADKTKENGWPIDDEGTFIEDELSLEQRIILDKEDEWQRIIRQYSSMQGFDWVRSGNIHDKGENRVNLDYRYMVTGINRTEMNTNPNGRRLLNENMNKILQNKMVDELTDIIKGNKFGEEHNINWQLVIEQITDKFAPMVKIIQKILQNEEENLTPDEIALQITRYTFNFILRFSHNNPDDELALSQGKSLALYQYTKPVGKIDSPMDKMIWSSTVKVVEAILDEIYFIHDQLLPIVQDNLEIDEIELLDEESKSERINLSKTHIDELVSQLYWIPLAYQCDEKCKDNEICYTPSWGPSPMAWKDTGSSNDSHGNHDDRGNPGSHMPQTSFGIHYDPDLGRNVIDRKLQCINADILL